MSRTRGATAAISFLLSLVSPALAAPPQLPQTKRTVEVFPERVLARYAACRERNDLKEMELLLQQHLIQRIDATIYGLPKDDFDDQILLTVEERLMVRRDREMAGNALPTSGPIQYPHHMRQTLDHYYLTTGQRPDCSKILEDAKDQMELVELPEEEAKTSTLALIQPLALGSSWGTDKDLTAGTVDRGEVNIALDVANQGRIMASSVPAGGSETSDHIERTSNWGATWNAGQVGNNSGSTWECDPVSFYKSANGEVFHSKIGCSNGFCTNTYVMMRRSSDNGANWSDCAPPSAATNSDRQWHVVDNTSTSPGYGNIYMTWHDGNSEKVVTSTSAQNCGLWNSVVTLTPSGTITPDINVGRDGHVYAVFGRYGATSFQIAGSTDQGATWDAPSVKSIKSYNGDWSNKVLPQCGSRGVSTQPLVDVNRCNPASGNCSQTHPGRVYVAMMDFNASCLTQAAWTCATWDSNYTNTCHYTVWFMYSDDSGATWSTPKDLFGATGINDGNTVDHILGYMRVDQVSGDTYITYSRTTLNPGSASDRQKTHQFVARSTDAGATFTAYQASSMYGDERTGSPSSFERGDYAGSTAVYNGVNYPIWIDRRSNTTVEHIITRKVCSEPTHWSERGTAPAAPATNVAGAGGTVVNVTWASPDLFWGDGDENNSARKYQLWVDGVLKTDNILWSSTSVSYDAGDNNNHTYVMRAINQCGISKDHASKLACASNPGISVAPGGPLSLCLGDTRTLTATISGGNAPFTYQWRRDGTNIAGAAASSLTISESGTHAYDVVVTGNGCSPGAASAATTITWAGAPSFSGVGSVSGNPNATCQLVLSWNAATSSCSGTITYTVYRSTTSGFTPGPNNRIASGVTGTTHTDSSGVSGTTYYYVVRAVAPNGIEDTNTVQASGIPLGVYGTWSATAETGSDTMTKNSPWALKTIYKHAGTYSYGVNTNASSYPINTCAGLESPPLAMHPTNAATLGFWHIYSFETAQGKDWDGGRVEIQDTAIGTWNVLVAGSRTIDAAGNACGWPVGTAIYGNNSTSYPTFQQVSNVAIPASYRGKTIKLRWVFSSDGLGSGNQSNPGWYVDDIAVTQVSLPGACNTPPDDVSFFTATYKDSSVKVEWKNPGGSWTTTRICRKVGSAPTGPTDGFLADTAVGGANGHGYYVDNTALNGTTYYYAAFAYNGTSYSGGLSVRALPKAASKVTWGFGTRAAALTTPGVYPGAAGTGTVYVVSNDRSLYAVNISSNGGDWFGSYMPISMNAPSQAPPVPFPVFNNNLGGGVTRGLFLGSQDGSDNCVNAASGASPMWTWTSPGAPAGDLIQAGTMFAFTGNIYGAQYDFVFPVTRNGGADNKVYALLPTTGVAQFSFDNGGGANGIGIITGIPWVDTSVTPNRLYFTSRKRAGGSQGTLWCLDINANSFSLRAGFPVDVGETDAGINIQHGRIYVGNNSGELKCVNKDTGAVNWTYTPGTADGPVKAYVAVTRAGVAPWRCYYSTNTKVWAVDDNGASSGTLAWSVGLPGGASPSYPLYPQGTDIWVSGSDGTLYQLSTAGASTGNIVVESGATLGSPAYWTSGGVKQVYVGTNTGAVYGVTVPLP